MNVLAVIAVALGIAAVVEDLRRGVIPNWLTVAGIGAGLVFHGFTRGWAGLGTAAAGLVVGFAAFLALYCLGGLGGGDVKLMAAFGALLGPLGILTAAVLASAAGGLIAVGALIFRRRRQTIPYGPAIVLGCWLALLAGR